ncbi:DNA repair protein rad16 [Coemansia javaensis]|uniref:DNA repair protein rad16 n=1 Tax=Coemansia javaensis TaxID=2761396 RepID=A0A9W8HD93_9FUNG|nr:DNA repair protein rad16 [Coemansia javaensis]
MVVTRGAKKRAQQPDADSATASTPTAVATPADSSSRSSSSNIDQDADTAADSDYPNAASDGSDDDFQEPQPSRWRKRAASTPEPGLDEPPRKRARGEGWPAAAPPKKKNKAKRGPRPATAAQMMPVASDMRLVLGSCAGPGPSAGRSSGSNLITAAAAQTPARRRFKRKSDGTKTRTELIEGDLTDDDDDSTSTSGAVGTKQRPGVRPHALPMDHIDYSKYTRLFSHHPHLAHVWSQLPEPRAPQRIAQPDALRIKLLPFQQEGVHWMATQEQTQFNGGILADEMGMGKTLQTIALMLVNRGKPTLVVCPTVALLQWRAEIEAATDALSVYVYYGNARKGAAKAEAEKAEKAAEAAEAAEAPAPRDMAAVLQDYDVVLTTYAVMESEFRRERTGFRQKGVLRHEPSVLHRVPWFRLVLDEAHHLKDRWCSTARAAFEISAQRVWSLTGTPLHNRVGELFSLIRLTRSDPFTMYFCHACACRSLHWEFSYSRYCDACGCKRTLHFSYWNMHILKPIQEMPVQSTASRVGFKKLDRLLDNVMLRRTKVERAQDLGLPPRIVVTRRDKFSPEEEDLYVSLFTNYQREFETYTRHGTVLNNYANLFELITRMRLAANHPDLLRLKIDARDRVGAAAEDTLVCAICAEEAEDPIMAKCRHVFCRADAQQFVGAADAAEALRCPACFALFDIDLTQPEMARPKAPGSSTSGSAAAAAATLMETMTSTPSTTEYRRSIVNRIDMRQWRSSTKIEALVEELSRHRQGNASIKSIVFSQFVNFLDLIQWRLNRAGFSVCRLDGRMTPAQRDAVIRTFMTRPEYTVFLVSLKAGGVALNLTEASHVYLADCWWNPSVEVQAMDRIHRMGQYRPIKVTRIIIDNSIESRIVALQVKKQLLVESTIGRDKKSLDRLSAQDMQFLFA